MFIFIQILFNLASPSLRFSADRPIKTASNEVLQHPPTARRYQNKLISV